MSQIDVGSILNNLVKLENVFINDNEKLDKIDQSFRDLVSVTNDLSALVNYNMFRIRNVDKLSYFRPRVLIGGMNASHFPNFHTIGLLRVADVISLSTVNENRIDRVYWNPFFDKFQDILTRLPNGFVPDLFFDNQIDGKHFIPIDIENSQIPTICCLCHMFRYDIIKLVSNMFDFVLPLSNNFSKLISRFAKTNIVDIPFGLNWASFRDFIKPVDIIKDIDISITFQPEDKYRNKIYKIFKKFTYKYNKYKYYIADKRLERNKYIEILNRSKISINVVGDHGPYNYRTCEIINSGATLMQYTNSFHDIKTSMNDYFENMIHYVEFDENNFEKLAINMLENDKERKKIAQSGLLFLNETYNYEKLYSILFDKISLINLEKKHRNNKINSKFNIGAIYFNYNDKNISIGMHIAIEHILNQDTQTMSSNLLALIPKMHEYYNYDQIKIFLSKNNELKLYFEKGMKYFFEKLFFMTNNNLSGKFNYFVTMVYFDINCIEFVNDFIKQINNMDDISYLDNNDIILNKFITSKNKTFNDTCNNLANSLNINLLNSSNTLEISKYYKDYIQQILHHYANWKSLVNH